MTTFEMCTKAPEGLTSRDGPHPKGVWPLLGVTLSKL